MKPDAPKAEDRLTQEQFWDVFWSKVALPSVIDEHFSFERCLAGALRKRLPHAAAGSKPRLVEIGCAPGRWMVFCQKELGFATDGIEYVPAAVALTRKNLAMCGVQGEVFEVDFFNHQLPLATYDVVLSLGFIEHFEDVDAVMTRHMQLVKPGGLVVLGVPNLRGINYPLQWFLDRELLGKHNTSVMDPAFFRGSAAKLGMEVVSIDYVGSFEPAIFGLKDPPRRSGVLAGATGAIGHAVRHAAGFGMGFLHQVRDRAAFADAINHALFSSYLLAVLRRAPEAKP